MYAGIVPRYEFRQLTKVFSQESITRVADSLCQRYSRLAKQWSPERNSEWLCRTYFSAKMLMAATLSANSLQYARSHNLRPVIYYLRYYTIFSLFRALGLLLPEKEWRGGKLLSSSHRVVINDATSLIAFFSPEIGRWAKEEAMRLKAIRELISYHAPSSGDAYLPQGGELGFFELAADLAQFCSELLERCVQRNASPESFRFLDEYASELGSVNLEGITFSDPEDLRRVDYLARKQPQPVDLATMLSEGHIESFFGAWCEDDPQQGHFDPDVNWQLLFDLR